ncbi:fumarylacetoacetate hydrolase domain containing protein [Pseudohyphozyma bogoriensis]|nr:fumarylacetoacetate hydrolase domain containing protein [Pseudohyphozyma bogoriensis]
MSDIPTRTIRFIASEDGKTYYGAPVQTGDLGLLYHSGTKLSARVLSGSPLSPSTKLTSRILSVKKLLSPLAPAEIQTIRGMGAQYAADKSAVPKPKFFNLFYKPLNTIAGPEDPIVIPQAAVGWDNDYEVELCVVLGKEGKDIPVEKALEHVFGYCVVNDVTSRGLAGITGRAIQGNQWGQAKSADSWCPLGPVLVSAKEINDPQKLALKTTVNGALKQSSNTSEMLLSVAELISMMSAGTTLEKGSIILTGSPLPLKSVVNDTNRWLVHGDEVRCEVEGLGTLINKIVEERGPRKSKL